MKKPQKLIAAIVLATVSVGLFFAPSQAATAYLGSGWDVSYPQCNSKLPSGGDFAVVGVNNGIAWSANPCLAAQLDWADSTFQATQTTLSVYANLADPLTSTAYSKGCAATCPQEYGAATADNALGYFSNLSYDPTQMFWWLDIETGNSWDGTADENVQVINAYIAELVSQGVPPTSIGIYSTPSQWGQITGAYGANVEVAGAAPPVWLAGAHAQKTASQYCAQSYSFTAGPVYLVQYFTKGYDADLACSSGSSGGGGGTGGSGGGAGGGHGHGKSASTRP